MREPSTVNISADTRSDTPVRRKDISAGKLVLRQRGANGAVVMQRPTTVARVR